MARMGRKRKSAVRATHGETGGLQGDDMQQALADFRTGRFEQAAARFEQLRRLGPDRHDARTYLGLALKGLGQLGRALEIFEQAAAAQPDDAVTQENLALVLAQLHRREEALSAFRRSLA